MSQVYLNPNCSLCRKPVVHTDDDNWYEVTGWVHGPKRDSLSLRELTGLVAHNECIRKAKQHIHPDDQAMEFE